MNHTSPNVNSVTLVGQLTSEPVLRAMADGHNVFGLRLAVNDQRDQPPIFIGVGHPAVGPRVTGGPSSNQPGRRWLRAREARRHDRRCATCGSAALDVAE
jgi:hypothetical protein